MRPVLLALGFGLLAIIGVACQPPTVYQPGGVSPTVGATRVALPSQCQNKGIMSPTDFVNQRAFFLPAGTNFDPRLGNPPSGPKIGAQPPAADLAAAFDAAPASFQAMLCDRDFNVFIVQNACSSSPCSAEDVIANSWGFRQQTSAPKRYIATSAGLWQDGSLPSFHVYEGMRFQAALNRLGTWHSPPQFSMSANPPVTSLLAALAHEAGHVLWYDAFVSPPGGSFQASSFCGGSFYPAGSWSSINIPHVNDTPGRWIDFGERISNETHNPDHAGSIKAALARRDPAAAGNELLKLFQNPELADFLAAFSPDEDFVEFYEWYVLRNAKPPVTVTNLTIQIPGHPPINIAGRTPSLTKAQCLTQYFQLPPQLWPIP